jgi:hypothetical protein
MGVDKLVARAGIGLGWLAAMFFLITGGMFFLMYYSIGSWFTSHFWTRTSAQISYELGPTRFSTLVGDRLSATSGRFGRRDSINLGSSANAADNLMIMVDYPNPDATDRFDRDVMAATRSLPGRWQFLSTSDGYKYALATRWGRLAGEGFVLKSDALMKNCISFVSRFETRAIIMSGYACAAPGRDVSVAEIACLIDGLRFVRLPSSEVVRAYVGAREAAGPACSAETTARPSVRGSYSSGLRGPGVNTYRTREERSRGF